jgi:hypothetical protein
VHPIDVALFLPLDTSMTSTMMPRSGTTMPQSSQRP